MIKFLLFCLAFCCVINDLSASVRAQINAREVKSLNHLHELLSTRLKFPAKYANMGESLYVALLSERREEKILKIKHVDVLSRKLGTEVAEEFIQTLAEASRENPRFIYVLE